MLDLCHHKSGLQHGFGHSEASKALAWCHATVSRLTSRLAVAAMCQHSNEHMLKVVVGEGCGCKTTGGDTINLQFLQAKQRGANLLTTRTQLIYCHLSLAVGMRSVSEEQIKSSPQGSEDEMLMPQNPPNGVSKYILWEATDTLHIQCHSFLMQACEDKLRTTTEVREEKKQN